MTETALQKYELTIEAVKDMADEYKHITVILKDKESYGVARQALTKCVRTRTDTDRRRKELTAEARKWQGDVNQAAKDLLKPLVEVEDHLKAELKKEDDRKEEKRQNEIDRINGIQEKISHLERQAFDLHQLEISELNALREYLENKEISLEEYQEFAQVAKTTKETTIATVKSVYEAKLKQEQEDAARKVENERLEKVRAEQEEKEAEQKAAQDKIEEEKAEVRAAKDKLDAEIKADQEQKLRDVFEKKTKEDARIKAEKCAQERAEREEQERIAKEEAEIEELERQKQLMPDKEKLIAYADNLLSVVEPELSTTDAKEILGSAIVRLEELTDTLKYDTTDL